MYSYHSNGKCVTSKNAGEECNYSCVRIICRAMVQGLHVLSCLFAYPHGINMVSTLSLSICMSEIGCC